MPYITQENRAEFEHIEEMIQDFPPTCAGDIQYMVAILIREYMRNNPYRYQTMNDVMGALNGANLEFYRRYVGPYEDECIGKNGDVKFDKETDDGNY